METTAKRILWVDDEVDLLEPHRLVLGRSGYDVDTTSNGDDALELARSQSYDLVLLDEQMPGRSGLDVLDLLRRDAPHARVVMVTKSAEDGTLRQAVGRSVDGYLVKPTSPRQVLAVVTRLLEGGALRHQQAARDLASRFSELSSRKDAAAGWDDYAALYSDLVDWDLRLDNVDEPGLAEALNSLMLDVRREFSRAVVAEYGDWVRPDAPEEERPLLSTDLVSRHLAPRLRDGPVLMVILDCLRLDQWRTLRPLLAPEFHMDESLYCSILPTATPYSRNAIFSGAFPDHLARDRPEWWESDEGSRNAFEDELLAEQLRRITGRDVPVHYEKVFTEEHGDELLGRVRGAFGEGGVTALVFNFVDQLTHGRSESNVLLQFARDARALRSLTRQWFERSVARRVLSAAASLGVPSLITTDHGSILCERPATVFAGRDATSNLRYKFGGDLRAEDPSTAFAVRDESELRMPEGRLAMSCLVALEDHFFVYPTKLREYQARYRGSFLHGGISPEEMILPVVSLMPRHGGRD